MRVLYMETNPFSSVSIFIWLIDLINMGCVAYHTQETEYPIAGKFIWGNPYSSSDRQRFKNHKAIQKQETKQDRPPRCSDI